MDTEVADTWLVGVVAHDEALSGLRVHGGLLAVGPAGGQSVCVRVRLRYRGAEGTLFPDADESAGLVADEERLVAALADRAVFVAALTVPGFRDLVFHTDDAAASRRTAGDLGFDDVEVDDDPGWSFYRSLFADAVTADGDRRRIQNAARTSGEGAPVCPVVHRFSFPSLAEADQAAAALRESGIEVVFVAADDVAESAPPMFTLTDTESLTQVEMARSRDALGGFASSWGGTYQGWEIIAS